MNLRTIAALTRAGWRTALSYRLRFFVSLLATLVTLVPVYFVSRAVQPMMAPLIANEGTQYFAFVTVGLFATILVGSCVTALPEAIASDLNSGFFEAVISTPSGAGSVAVGLSAYAILRNLLRGTVLVLVGALLGIHLVWVRIPEALLIVVLIATAHFGVGLLAAALVVAFRTNAAIPQVVLVASGLLGGVYYPTTVIPSWIANLSDVVPLGYGLRALRHTLLDGQGLESVMNDLGILTSFAVVLITVGAMAYRMSLQYARQAGSLSQY